MASLSGKAPGTTFKDLLHIYDGDDNEGLVSALKTMFDGDGAATNLQLSTANININNHNGSTGLMLNGTLVTSSAAEINKLNGITPGTVTTAKFVLVDSNKDISGFRNITASGTITAANFIGTGNVQIGDAPADTLALNATITTNLIFEGSSANDFELTLSPGNPTADRTLTLPNETGTIATQAHVTTQVNNLIDSAPTALDTLNELAAALNDDANFGSTVTTSLATKAPIASPTFTGTLTAPTALIKPSSGVSTLIIEGHTDARLVLKSDLGGANGDWWYLKAQEADHDLVIINGSTERFRFTDDGKFGIGTASPTQKLVVWGQVMVDNWIRGYENATAHTYERYWMNFNSGNPIHRPGSSDKYHKFQNYSGSDVMVVGGTNNRVGIGTASPSGAKLQIAQSADSEGLKITGYDDRNDKHANLFITSAGDFDLTASGHISINGGGNIYMYDYLMVQDRITKTGSGTLQFGGTYDVDMHFLGASDAVVMAIDNGNKRVGIGTSSPSQPLHIKVNNNNSDPHFFIENANASGRSHVRFWNSSRNTYWSFGQDSDDVFKIGNSAHLGTASTIKFKLTGTTATLGANYPFEFTDAWTGIIKHGGNSLLTVNAGSNGTVSIPGSRQVNVSGKLDVGSSKLSMVANSTSGNVIDMYSYGGVKWDLQSYYNEKFIINYNSGTAASPTYSPAFVISNRSGGGKIGIGTTSPTAPLHIKTAMSTNTNTDALKVEGNYLLAVLGGDDALYNAGKLELYQDGSTKNVHLSGTASTSYPSYILGRLGIGTSSPNGKVAIHSASAGGSSAIYNRADELVIENSDHAGITIKSPTNKETSLFFGDADDSSRGGIRYDHATDTMKFQVGSTPMYLKSTGLGIGTTSPSEKLEIAVTDNNTAFSFNRATVADNNFLGNIEFKGNNGTETHTYSKITAQCLNFEDGAEYSDVKIYGSNGSNGLEEIAKFYARQLLLTNSGSKVGIRTASPSEALHVVGNFLLDNTTPTMTMKNGSTFFNEFKIIGGSHTILKTSGGSQDLIFGTGDLEKMRLKGSNLGIGTTSPSDALHLYNAGSSLALKVERDNGSTAMVSAGGSTSFFGTNDATDIEIGTNLSGTAQVMMFLDHSTNRIGIGTSSPLQKLHVNGIIQTASELRSSSGNGLYLQALGTSGGFTHRFQDNGTDRATMNSDGIQLPLKASDTSHKLKLTATTSAEIYATGYGDLNLSGGLSTYIGSVKGTTFRSASSGGREVYIKTISTDSYGYRNISSNMTNFSIYSGITGHFGFTTVGSSYTYNAITNVHTDNNTSGLKLNYRTGGTDTEAMRITSAGKVGIGTTSPSFGKLQVNPGSSSTTGLAIWGANDGIKINRSAGGNDGAWSQITMTDNDWIHLKTYTESKGIGVDRIGGANSGINPANNYIQFSGYDKIFSRSGTTQLTMGNGKVYYENVNVGIGTSSPSYKFVVNEASDHARMQIQTGSVNHQTFLQFEADRPADNDIVGNIQFRASGNVGSYIKGFRGSADSKGDLVFGTSDADRMRIDESGNIGLGETSPTHLLEVKGHVAITDGYNLFMKRDGSSLRFTADGKVGGTNNGEMYMSADGTMNWSIAGTSRMSLTQNGISTNAAYVSHVIAGGGGDLNVTASGTNLNIGADYDSTNGQVHIYPTGLWSGGSKTATFHKDYTDFKNKPLRFAAASDPSAVTNNCHLYAKDVSSSAELFAQDEAGNVTQISPHDENGEWVFNSKNIKTKIRKRIRMEKLIRKLEDYFGEQFIEEILETT